MWGLKRIHQGLLSNPEQRLIRLGLPRIPSYISPDHLCIIALVGALLSGVSAVLCWYSPLFLSTFVVGLLLHWFGDSFDGALARYRKIERPKAGLLIDRWADLLSYLTIIGGLGFSPYLSPILSLLLLIGVLVNAIYSMLLSVTDKKQVVGIGGLGGTEGRLLLVFWCMILQFTGRTYTSSPFGVLGAQDYFASILLIAVVVMFSVSVFKRIAHHSSLEKVSDARSDSSGQDKAGVILHLSSSTAPGELHLPMHNRKMTWANRPTQARYSGMLGSRRVRF